MFGICLQWGIGKGQDLYSFYVLYLEDGDGSRSKYTAFIYHLWFSVTFNGFPLSLNDLLIQCCLSPRLDVN